MVLKIIIVVCGMLIFFFWINLFCKLYIDLSYVWIISVVKFVIMIFKRVNELYLVNFMFMFFIYIGYIFKMRFLMYVVICLLFNKLKVYIIRFEKNDNVWKFGYY